MRPIQRRCSDKQIVCELMFLVLFHFNISVNHNNIVQYNVGPIPGHFDTPVEAKVDKVKTKCQTMNASLSLV